MLPQLLAALLARSRQQQQDSASEEDSRSNAPGDYSSSCSSSHEEDPSPPDNAVLRVDNAGFGSVNGFYRQQRAHHDGRPSYIKIDAHGAVCRPCRHISYHADMTLPGWLFAAPSWDGTGWDPPYYARDGPSSKPPRSNWSIYSANYHPIPTITYLRD